MKYFILFTLFIFKLSEVYGQNVNDTTIVIIADESPKYPDKLFKLLSNTIKYPEIARQHYLQGKIVVRFVVEKDGSLSNLKCIGTKLNREEAIVLYRKYAKIKKIEIINEEDEYVKCEQALITESIRVISLLPPFKAAVHKGQIVRSYYTIPIVLKLE